jgi:hypothetical protein
LVTSLGMTLRSEGRRREGGLRRGSPKTQRRLRYMPNAVFQFSGVMLRR